MTAKITIGGQKNRSHYLILAAAMISFYVVLAGLTFVFPKTCTNISLSHQGAVLFANNEDTHFRDLMIGFYPASVQGYGSVHIGFRQNDGVVQFGGAMNDQGLAWDLNTAPRLKLTPHPEKPFSHEEDNFLSTITKNAATVEEAINIAQEFNFGESMAYQFHIADASGDAVVISAGPDGELAFTRKAEGDGYLVLTNFNPADHREIEIGWRYETANSMLENIDRSQQLLPDYTGSILEAVHLNNLTSYTLYSNIFDLKNNDIYLYYMSQYDEVVVLNLEEELAKGERVVELREYFSSRTVELGDEAYQRFEARFITAKFIVILGGLTFFLTGAAITTYRIKTKWPPIAG